MKKLIYLLLITLSISQKQNYIEQYKLKWQNDKIQARVEILTSNNALDLNTTLKDHQDLGVEYNDIWGFKENNQQYVIISKALGFAVYKIANSGAAELIVDEASTNNENNLWGEVRYYNGYVYKSTEADSVRIYSLDLINKTSTYIKRFHGSAHNISLYQNYLLTCGGATGVNGGVACYDITDPLNPQFKWLYDKFYVHDFTVQNDTLYLAELYNSSFALYDISNVIGTDLAENKLLLRHKYSGGFTHNIWPSPNGKYVVTTDEHNTFDHLQLWDISDVDNVQNLMKHREGPASIVHNAFIKNDFIYTSYYSNGFVVFDISDKRLPVKIGHYDAYPPNDLDNYNGTWGVYPFMDSNYVALSNSDDGLDIVEFDQSIRAGKLTVIFYDTLNIPFNQSVNVSVNDNKYVKYYQDGNTIILKGKPESNYQLTFSVPAQSFSKQIDFQFMNNADDSISYRIHEEDTTAPIQPVIAAVSGGNNNLSIIWQKNTETDIAKYLLYLDTIENSNILYDSVDFSISSKLITNLQYNKRYYVRIRAKDLNGNLSLFSNELSAITIDSTEPSAPYLTEIIPSNSSIRLFWQLNPETDIASYNVYIDTIISPLKLISNVDKNTNVLEVSNLINGKLYYVRIQAVDSNGNLSLYSNELSAQPQINIGLNLNTKISVFQNPVLKDHINISFGVDLILSSLPKVNINSVPLTIIKMDNRNYSAPYKLSSDGNYQMSIHMEAFGAISDTNLQFQVQTISKEKREFELDDIQLKLSLTDLETPLKLLTESSETNESITFLNQINLKEKAKLSIRYNSNRLNKEKIFIYQYTDNSFKKVPTQIFQKHQIAVAYISRLTEFKLDIDPDYDGNNLVPESFKLSQNYPNPFNPNTTIQYDLPSDGQVRLEIYNILGQRVRTLLNEFQFASVAKKVKWDGKSDSGSKVASGIYIYKISTQNYNQTKKMILIK